MTEGQNSPKVQTNDLLVVQLNFPKDEILKLIQIMTASNTMKIFLCTQHSKLIQDSASYRTICCVIRMFGVDVIVVKEIPMFVPLRRIDYRENFYLYAN